MPIHHHGQRAGAEPVRMWPSLALESGRKAIP